MTTKNLPESLSAASLAADQNFALRSPHLLTPNADSGSRTTPILLRPYQLEAFQNRTNGIEAWMWGRQTGKSFTLAAWAVSRLIERPGRLVTILSNSLPNGAELNHKCAQIARQYAKVFQQADLSSAPQFDCMNYETRLRVGDNVGRIKILPANPRTARGFSGDLILDEFAFHEDSTAIWEAAEPILSANPDFLCRIASTPNGRHNMFYRLITDPSIPKRIVPRSEAWRQGLIISHPVTRQPITPDEARALAHDKRAYDQNYECIFESENMALLTHDLISAAEEPLVGFICNDQWSRDAIAFFNGETLSPDCSSRREEAHESIRNPNSPIQKNLFVGVDVGRSQDLTVITALEKIGDMFYVRAILRLHNIRLPQQQELLEVACRSPRFASAHIDMTGLGLGLYEYTHQKFSHRITGVNFASNLPLKNGDVRNQNVEVKTARAPEVLALGLLQAYESKRIRQPIDALLREDLHKPERITTAEGRVSIVASRSESGHADHFWSLALALHAATTPPPPVSGCARSFFVPGRSADLRWMRRGPRRRRFFI